MVDHSHAQSKLTIHRYGKIPPISQGIEAKNEEPGEKRYPSRLICYWRINYIVIAGSA